MTSFMRTGKTQAIRVTQIKLAYPRTLLFDSANIKSEEYSRRKYNYEIPPILQLPIAVRVSKLGPMWLFKL